MKKVARMLVSHIDGLLGYCYQKNSNATAEGFNFKIQAVKSNVRGFRSFEK